MTQAYTKTCFSIQSTNGVFYECIDEDQRSEFLKSSGKHHNKNLCVQSACSTTDRLLWDIQGGAGGENEQVIDISDMVCYSQSSILNKPVDVDSFICHHP